MAIIVSTTPSLEGRKTKEYLGIVAGEAILGANIFRDFFSAVRDVVGGRSKSYERELRRAREIAEREMIEKAAALGANAVLGADIDYETVGRGMLMVSMSGTAVVVE